MSAGVPGVGLHVDPEPPQNRSPWSRLLTFFGFCKASPARRSLVNVIWNLAWGFIQVTVVTVVFVLVSLRFKDPSNARTSEWVACDKPLGVLGSLWIVRVILASTLTLWEFLKARNLRQRLPGATATSSPTSLEATRDVDISAEQYLPNSVVYSRLSVFSTVFTVVWFLSAHILVYTSIHTCRRTSPHLWWLLFSIMCILYLMILEVVVLGFVVLILAPILFIIWNIILISRGRHPIQNTETITPDIGKLSKSVVDNIPLRVYIPAPPAADADLEKASSDTYPPKPTAKCASRMGHSTFLRRVSLPLSRRNVKSMARDVDGGDTNWSWMNQWEKTEYSFVPLEENRAICAICLIEFEEPKRKIDDQPETEGSVPVKESNTAGDGDSPSSAGQSINQEERASASDTKLSDIGEGAQPLRLLDCSHAFHKSCIDPWLTNVSGRCPTCNKAVKTRRARLSRFG